AADGSYTYDVNDADPAVDALNVGQTLPDSFTYTVSDGSKTDTASLTITIHGTDDAPVAVADTGSATEGAPASHTDPAVPALQASGNVLANDTDVDTAAASLAVTAV